MSVLKYLLINLLASLVLLLAGTSPVIARSECASWLTAGPAALFNRGLSLRKIDNLISDRYSSGEIDAFLVGSKVIAENAAIIDQARPRQAITPAPEIDQKLRIITDRILAAWPHAAPDFDMYLTSWRYYTMFATLDGDILVPIGFLQRSQSDDEIAFLLAHEISHLLLGHPIQLAKKAQQKKSLRGFRKKGGKATSYAAAAASLVALTQTSANWAGTAAELTRLNRRVFQYYEYLRDFTTEFIHPMWQSKQEDEADLLALELFLLAGYSPDGVDHALRNLQTAEESACESIRQFTSELENFVKVEFAEHVKQSLLAGETDFRIILFKEATVFSKKKIAELLVKQALPKTHRPYEKRREYIWKFADRPGMEAIMEAADERDASNEIVVDIQQSEVFDTLLTSARAVGEIKDALLSVDMAAVEKNIPDLFMGSQQARILKYRFHMARGEPDLAYGDIDMALQDEYPALLAYEVHFAGQLQDGGFESASKGVNDVQRRYGDHVHFLPEKIFISANQTAGKASGQGSTDSLLKQCTGSNRDNIEGPCYAAALGSRADFRDRYEEILATSDCATVKENGGDVVCDGLEKKGILSGLKFWDKDKDGA